MTKPTLLQRLFNAPSQSYAFPAQEKNYHSAKPTLLKVATQDDPIPKFPHTLMTIFPSDRSATNPSPLTLVEETESEATSEEEFHTPDSAVNPALSPTASGDQSLPSSAASSTDSVADDSDSETIEASVFSSLSASTHVTTPSPSDSGRSKSPSFVPTIASATTITISSTSRSSSRTPSVSTKHHATYTDEDWAKEVRWLVPPQASNSSSNKKQKRSRGPTIVQRADHRSLTESKKEPLRKVPKGKTRMSAVPELPEDEDGDQSSQHSRPSGITYRRTRPSLDASAGKPWIVHHPTSRSTPSLSSIFEPHQTVSIPSTSHIHSEPGTSSRGTAPYTSLVLPRANVLPPAHSTYSSASARNSLLSNGGTDILQKLKVEDIHKVDLSRSGLAATTMATIEIVKGTAEAGNRPGGLTRSFSQRLSTRLKSRGKNGRPPGHLAREMPTPLGFCSHLSPPTHVSPHHVLVQVWAVGLDSRDAAIVLKDKQNTPGFIPGRSFVGRVVEVGWEVRGDIVKKGEWVVGLTEVKKSGALAEFITIDRHRIHRVPGPAPVPTLGALLSNSRPPSRAPSPSPSVRSTRSTASKINKTGLNSVLTVEELALLPICGVFAYRAVKTFDPSALNPAIPAPRKSRPRRILILDGHNGVGALSAQMLIRRGWKVIAHISPEAVSLNGDPALRSGSPFKNIEKRLRRWGVEDVCLGEATAVITMLGERCKAKPREYVIDGVLDTIGGLDIWNAALQHILSRSPKPPNPEPDPTVDDSMPPQFTTLVGDDKERTIPSAQDHFKAGFRSMKRAMNALCGYAWVSVAADIDGEGLDVRDALAGTIKWVEETRGQVKPYVESQESPISTPMEGGGEKGPVGSLGRVVVFENAPDVFAEGAKSLKCGGNVVVRVAS